MSCRSTGHIIYDLEFFDHHPDSIITLSTFSGFETSIAITDFKERHFGLLNILFWNSLSYDHVKESIVFGYHSYSKDPHLNFDQNSVIIPKQSALWEKNSVPIDPSLFDSLLIPFSIIDVNPYNNIYFGGRNDSLLVSKNSGQSIAAYFYPFNYFIYNEFRFLKNTPIIFSSLKPSYRQNYSPISLLRIDYQNEEIKIDTVFKAHYLAYTFDPEESGELFVSDSLRILLSKDIGNSFTQFMSFSDEVTGLYKKPNSDILYVLTREELFEVNTLTKETVSLKKLPVSNEMVQSEIPKKVSLHQNYPNPFNPATVISYQLTGNSLVRLEVFDVTGRKVAVLVDGERKPVGTYRVHFDGSGLSSGVYFYRLDTGEQTLTKKMLLIK